MKFYLSIIFLAMTFCLNVNAQENNELKPCLTKKESKKNKTNELDFLKLDPIEVNIELQIQTLTKDKSILVIKTGLNSKELFFGKISDEISVAAAELFIRIRSADNKFKGCFEEELKFNLNKNEVEKGNQLNFTKSFELAKGVYRLDFIIRDKENGKIGIVIKGFQIK